jgi:hypothetical protein
MGREPGARPRSAVNRVRLLLLLLLLLRSQHSRRVQYISIRHLFIVTYGGAAALSSVRTHWRQSQVRRLSRRSPAPTIGFSETTVDVVSTFAPPSCADCLCAKGPNSCPCLGGCSPASCCIASGQFRTFRRLPPRLPRAAIEVRFW